MATESGPGATRSSLSRSRRMVTSKTPMNVGELIEALSLFPPERSVYVGVLGGSWTRPTRVRFGNAHNPEALYVTIDNGNEDDDR